MSDTLLSASPDGLSGPLQQLVEMGGPVILVLLALAIAGLVSFFYLMLTGAVYAPRHSRAVRTALGHWAQAPDRKHLQRLQASSGWLARRNPLRDLVMRAMQGRLARQHPDRLREVLSRDAGSALETFEAPLKVVEVVAALAPLLGLLGTVLGMMDAFGAMAATEGRANASQLSGGIYEALTTTAAGLVVAIPFAALAAWIEFRLRRLNKLVNAALVTVLTATLPEPAVDPEPNAANSASEPAVDAEPDLASGQLAHATG